MLEAGSWKTVSDFHIPASSIPYSQNASQLRKVIVSTPAAESAIHPA
jgi:hypothetical protein